MFTETDIRRETTERTYSRGRQLYMSANVQSIQVQDVYLGETKCKKIKAYVQGSSWKCYNTSAIVNEETGIVSSYQCDCPANAEYAGLCKHLVASLLRYIQVEKDQKRKEDQPLKKITVEFPQTDKLKSLGLTKGADFWGKEHTPESVRQKAQPIASMPKTDTGLYRILMGNGLENQLPYRQPGIKGKVQLVPILHEHYGKMSVEFKIGIDHMYVLKNVMEFADNMRRNEFKQYGAKLEFYHHLSAFTKESTPLVKLLLEITTDFKNNTNSINVYQFYTRNDTKRQIPLAGSHLDRFLALFEDKEILLCNDFEENVKYHVVKGEPDIPLRIQGTPAGIRLLARSFPMVEGAAMQYLFDDRKKQLFQVPLEEIRKIQSFREYMNRQRGNPSFIAEKELSVFCRDLLPELSKHYELEITDFSPEKYLPEEVSFEIYLDMPEYDKITCRLKAVYAEESYDVFTIENRSRFIDFSTNVVTEKRDVQKEMEADAFLSHYFPEQDEKQPLKFFYGSGDEIYTFLTETIHELSAVGEVFISEKMKKVQVLKAPTFSLGVSLKGNLLQLSLDTKEMPLEQLAELLSKYNRKKKYFRLTDGSFIDMQDSDMESLVSLVDGLQLSKKELAKGEITLPKYRALYLDSISREEEVTYMKKDKDFKELVRHMKSQEDNEFEVPASLQSIMRSYQKSGFTWLKTLHTNGFGGILADDMGLGKTLQVISFLLSELSEESTESRRALIVCPASLVYNWQSEIERFAPTLSTVLVAGEAAGRKSLVENSKDKDILITSYDLLKRDLENYENVDFFCEIIDEAQFIKNQNTQAARAVKAISAGTKFALTGTPMENRLSELWSIFDYLMPGFLYGYKQFKEELESPIVEEHDEEAMLVLRRFITPFVLRRLKKDVLKDLPDKLEEVVYAKLEDEQQQLYEANVQHIRMQLGKQTEKEFKESKLQLLAELTRLRQLCCNPSLVYENYKGAAAKMDVCMELLQNAIEGGHKVLVFSQFTSMLSLLTKKAEEEGISYYTLTGQTPKEQRAQMVESFNKDETQVFFISLKAGGTGLNLTSADIVIHFDPWWNVAAQNQATDRTHRIGQKNVVTVYKLIAKNTIEEKIMKLQEAKKELADQVLGGENMDNPTFSKEELLELLS